MNIYTVEAVCKVVKLLTIEASDEEEAMMKAEEMDVIDEQELEMIDWEVDGTPEVAE